MFKSEDLIRAKKRKHLISIAEQKGIDIKKVLRNLRYEHELRLLQAELVNLQQWVSKRQIRVCSAV